MGGSIGLAVLATIAIDHTHAILGGGQGAAATAAALTSGYARAFALAAIFGIVAFAASFIVPSIGPKRSAGAPVVESPVGSLPVRDPAGQMGADVQVEPAG
jgi:hypothetical protein